KQNRKEEENKDRGDAFPVVPGQRLACSGVLPFLLRRFANFVSYTLEMPLVQTVNDQAQQRSPARGAKAIVPARVRILAHPCEKSFERLTLREISDCEA